MKNRIGIVTVSLGLLEQWLHIPVGTRVIDVRSKDHGINGECEILVEGNAVPETDLLSPTPHLNYTVSTTAPKVTIELRDRVTND